MADAPLKEFAKLEKISNFSTVHGTRKHPTVDTSLDSLLESLHEFKQGIEAGATSSEVVSAIGRVIDEKKKEVDERQKEVHSALTRIGKLLDKKFCTPVPSAEPPLFPSPSSMSALDATVAMHLVRTGQFEVADTFVRESGAHINVDLRNHFTNLHSMLTSMRQHELAPALEWAAANRAFLQTRGSPLEFHLHRSQFIRILLSSNPPDPVPAVLYARKSIPLLYEPHQKEFEQLMTCPIFLPLARLKSSPYAYLTEPSIHSDLEVMLSREFCARLGLSKELPLRVAGDIGAGGALARIEKGRKVMKERRSEWSQMDELPIEIPLPPENRYHSIFVCPVSKEQSTDANPPMMISCGHVISKDSLNKLSKPGGRVKCPYCPIESTAASALQVSF